MYRIGVVGPLVSVHLIIEHAKEMQTDMFFQPYPYTIMSETLSIIETHDSEVDFWLFSGQIPYTIALKSTVSAEKMEYIYMSGEAAFQGILEKTYELGHLPNGVSFDMARFYRESFEEIDSLNKIIPHLSVLEYEIDDQVEQIFSFHYNLFKQGTIDLAITTYPAVQIKLQENGIPSYWIRPQHTEIYHSLQILTEKVKTLYYKGSQATAIVLQVEDYQQVKVENRSGYKIHFFDLDLKRALLEVCEITDGYLLDNGVGRYTIFSTRGVTEEKLPQMFNLLKRIERELGCIVSVGIGSASTVYHAEIFAQQALQHAGQVETIKVVVMNDDGEVIEYKKNNSVANYSSRSDNLEVIHKLNQTNISVKVFSKIESMASKMKNHIFTTKDIAHELSMSQRNGQRIVAELLKINLLEVYGEENRNTRGRSTKLYRLKA
ncbi:MAG: hypothetical protein KBT36_04605 [Kurthia sp.]|nr:hypothetical protein [Candidatus Kurthia equi]